MEIRELKPAEYAEGGRVTALAYREYAAQAPPDAADEWEDYLRSIADIAGRADRTVIIGALEDGRILGTATLELTGSIGDGDPDVPPDAANIRMLGVDPAARGRGAGRALVEACIGRTRSAGKERIVLHTTPPMAPAQGLYRSMGFVRDPERDVSFENGLELIAYQLRL